MPVDRLPRLGRRQDSSQDDDHERMSLLQSKSESRLRCLTTKHKHYTDLRSTKSETFHIN